MGVNPVTMRFFLPGMLLAVSAFASAAERVQLNFELTQGESKIESGRDFVSRKPHTWSKGFRRSYLQVRCQQQESGKSHKLFSTVDHFAGLLVKHKLAGDNVELTVIRSVVQPRLTEIRALGKNECRELAPVVTTASETYIFPAKDGVDKAHSFGNTMTFRVVLQPVD